MKGSIKVFRGLLEGWVVSVFAFTATAIAQAPFCDDFEDGNGWQSRWTSVINTQTLVSSPAHSGSGALKFRGVNGNCHSVMYRTNFQACNGEYSTWVNQQHFEAGVSMFVLVQPGLDPHPEFRDRYGLYLAAQNSEAGGTFNLNKRVNGVITTLGSKAPEFQMNEWIRMFMRRLPDGTIIGGYERQNGFRDSLIFLDPNPIITPGSFYIASCSDVFPTDNFFDDVCFTPISGPCGSTIPTLSEWGLIIFSLLLLGTIVFYVRKRRVRTQSIT